MIGFGLALVVSVLSLGVYSAINNRPLPPKDKAIAIAKQLAPPGSILSIESVNDVKTDKVDTLDSFSAILTITADRAKLSKDSRCSGTLKVNYAIKTVEEPLTLWESTLFFLLHGTYGTKMVATLEFYWIDAKAAYKSLANNPKATSKSNLEFDLQKATQGNFMWDVSGSNSDTAYAALYKSLAFLELGQTNKAAYSCLSAAKYATLSGAAHDEYEHVRQLVIAKLPPNSPDAPPALKDYNAYRKRLGLAPLKPGSAQ